MLACENPRKNIAHFMSICNFDRSCICVFVFVCLYVRHSVTWILTSSYHYLLKNIVHVIMALSCLSATFTEAVYVYLHVRHLGSLFSRSVYHYLSENIWFVWSKTFQNEEKLRCHACDGITDTHIGFAVFCWGRNPQLSSHEYQIIFNFLRFQLKILNISIK